MSFKKNIVLSLIIINFLIIPINAGILSIYDTPTTGVLDYGSYDLNFRLFSEGSVLTRLSFGVFRIVTLGFGWEVNSVIGEKQTVTVSPPTLHIKLLLYQGGVTLPALSIGYDGQGYFYNKEENEFLQRELGLYMVTGREILIPGLIFNLGCNMADFRNNKLYGFSNLSYSIQNSLVFLSEYIYLDSFNNSRLNLGLRLFITETLNIDIAGRDIGSSIRNTERIVQIGYRGKF